MRTWCTPGRPRPFAGVAGDNRRLSRRSRRRPLCRSALELVGTLLGAARVIYEDGTRPAVPNPLSAADQAPPAYPPARPIRSNV